MLFGALARALGQSDFESKDDVVAGIVIMDDIANGERRRQSKQMIATLLTVGMSPDDIKKLLG